MARKEGKKKKQDSVPTASKYIKVKQKKNQRDRQDARRGQVTTDEASGSRAQIQIAMIAGDQIPGIGTIVGFISEQYSRGLLTSETSPDQVAAGAQQMLTMIQNANNAATQSILQGPKWFAEYCATLGPRSIISGLGKISYTQPEGSTAIILPLTIPVGPPAINYVWIFLEPNGVTGADGFPQANASPASTADPATSWTSLITFAANSVKTNQLGKATQAQICQMTDVPGGTKRVASYFAYKTKTYGGGLNDQGGFAYTVSNEVPLFHPSLAVAQNVSASAANSPLRFPNYTMPFAGDGAWMTYMLTRSPFSHWDNKYRPHFHFIDFIELAQIAISWLQQCAQAMAKDPANPGNVVAPDVSNYTMQLTLQQFLFLLKNEIMGVFAETGPYSQGIYPALASGPSDPQFVPYIWMANTVPLAPIGLKLPNLLVENIRALTYRVVGTQRRSGKQDGTFYVPVLGHYNGDQEKLMAVNFTIDLNGTPVPLFSGATTLKKRSIRRNSQGKDQVIVESMVSDPIDLVDGYCAAETKYLFVNSQSILSKFGEIYNNYVTGISAQSVPVCTIGAEPGITALCAVSVTRHWDDAPGGSDLFFSGSMSHRNEGAPSDNRTFLALTSQGKIYSQIADQVFKYWSLPKNKNVSTGNPRGMSVPEYQSLNNEPYIITYTPTGGPEGVSCSEWIQIAATKMTKQRQSPGDDVTEFLEEMAKAGRGGWLTSIVSSIGGALFGPEASQVINTVGNAIGV